MPPKIKPWYERDGGKRLSSDQVLIAESYPDLTYRIDNEASRAFLEGSITLCTDSGIRTKIELRVNFPYAYPQLEPFAYDIGDRFPHIPDRHFYPSGCCCLWLPPESLWDGEDPNALRQFLDQVAIFFDKQLICDALGGKIWPGEARSHGGAGYVEFVQEILGGDEELLTILTPVFLNKSVIGRNDRCLCDSGKKFKKCHQDIVEEVNHRVGTVRLREAFRYFGRNQVKEAKIQSNGA